MSNDDTKKPIGTIDMTPTWVGVLPIYASTYEQSESSRSELLRMAKLADAYTALMKTGPIAVSEEPKMSNPNLAPMPSQGARLLGAVQVIGSQAELTARTFPNAPGRGDWLTVRRIARETLPLVEGLLRERDEARALIPLQRTALDALNLIASSAGFAGGTYIKELQGIAQKAIAEIRSSETVTPTIWDRMQREDASIKQGLNSPMPELDMPAVPVKTTRATKPAKTK